MSETIEIQSLQIKEMQNKLESQDKLISMIVHDMRNPSEAIHNGLN
jgi:hypothetical protein